MSEPIAHHYPPELFNLLVDTIPTLLKGKQAVLDFFVSCGVPPQEYAPEQARLRTDAGSINKYEIVRNVLQRINAGGDRLLAPRREILKKITQWDDFSRGYEDKRVQAEGYVAKVQKLVNVKDSFTRMADEREALAAEGRKEREKVALEKKRLATERVNIRDRLAALYGEADPHARGKLLESVLNDLFRSYGVLVREDFRRVGTSGEGVVEQIDGVISHEGHTYLVEMKWHHDSIGVDQVSQSLVRVYARGGAARGLVVSASGFGAPAVATVREALGQITVVLADLKEIWDLLEAEASLTVWLDKKVEAAVVDKNPFRRGP